MTMRQEEDFSNFFGAAPSFVDDGEDGMDYSAENGFRPGVRYYSSDELRDMAPSELVGYAMRLQHRYRQVENDNRVLTWEFREFQDHFTYFSRAAKLAHKLSASDIDTVAHLAVNEVPRYFRCQFAALLFYEEESGLLELNRATKAIRNGTPLHVDNDAGHFLVKLFRHQTEPFIIEKVDGTNEIETDTASRMRGVVTDDWSLALGRQALLFPLFVNNADSGKPLLLGSLIIGDPTRELEAKDAEVAALFSDLLSASLFNAKLVQRLNALTTIDTLTGLFNRRHLISQMAARMVQSRRHNLDLSIAILDIDHFKRINDTHGHIVGDKVLTELANLLRKTVRADIDIPARYGGEEFVIIMPYIDIDNAVLAAERIRRVVMNHLFIFGDLTLNLTCSFGVAQYIYHESQDNFLDRADYALYQAKDAGRNRVAAAAKP